MFKCQKCHESFLVYSAEERGRSLRLYVRCLKGHTGKRDIDSYQASGMAIDLFQDLFTCVLCGTTMILSNTDLQRRKVIYTFVCPIHGSIEKEIPPIYHQTVLELSKRVNGVKSVLNSLSCSKCGKKIVIVDMDERHGMMVMKVKCADGHSALRYISKNLDVQTLSTVLERAIYCNSCALPCTLMGVERKRNIVKIEIACPVHGRSRKEISIVFADLIETVSKSMSKETIVRSMLKCSECNQPLSIRKIERDKSVYKMKCSCVKDHTTEMTQQIDWSTDAADNVITAILKCNECNLLVHVLDKKVSGKDVEIRIICSLHGIIRKGLTTEVYKYLEEREPHIDRLTSIEKSLRCEKCDSPVTIKETKPKQGYIELEVQCRNDHNNTLFYNTKLDHSVLIKIYKHLYECHRCHDTIDLEQIEQHDEYMRATIKCPKHGEVNMDIPSEHGSAVRDAYLSLATHSKLEELIESHLMLKNECSYPLDVETSPKELMKVIKSIIEQHDVWYVFETSNAKGLEVWYYGMAMMGDQFVIIGSISLENKTVRISVSSDDEAKLNLLLTDMRENLREVLLKMQSKSDDVRPKEILCVHCGAALSKRGLPGETSTCEHCGTPLHWG